MKILNEEYFPEIINNLSEKERGVWSFLKREYFLQMQFFYKLRNISETQEYKFFKSGQS